MSLSASRSRLIALSRDLASHWQATRETWTDAQRDAFEKTYLAPLFAALERAGHALEQLDEVAAKVRKDCE